MTEPSGRLGSDLLAVLRIKRDDVRIVRDDGSIVDNDDSVLSVGTEGRSPLFSAILGIERDHTPVVAGVEVRHVHGSVRNNGLPPSEGLRGPCQVSACGADTSIADVLAPLALYCVHDAVGTSGRGVSSSDRGSVDKQPESILVPTIAVDKRVRLSILR